MNRISLMVLFNPSCAGAEKSHAELKSLLHQHFLQREYLQHLQQVAASCPEHILGVSKKNHNISTVYFGLNCGPTHVTYVIN